MRFPKTKGKRDRLTPITPELVGLLRRLRVQSLCGLGLFRCMADTLGRQWRRIRNTAGVPTLRLHDLRRTYITRPIRAKIMELWTWHKPPFSLLEGHVDIRHSEYANKPNIMAACKELAARMGTDQTIWCFTKRGQWSQRPGYTRVEWVLNVPCDEILNFVDQIVWNRIAGVNVRPPKKILWRWQDEAIARFPDDPEAQYRYAQEQWDKFAAQQPPDGSWWDHLFVEPQAEEFVSALVRHPMRPEWVEVNPLTEGQ